MSKDTLTFFASLQLAISHCYHQSLSLTLLSHSAVLFLAFATATSSITRGNRVKYSSAAGGLPYFSHQVCQHHTKMDVAGMALVCR